MFSSPSLNRSVARGSTKRAPSLSETATTTKTVTDNEAKLQAELSAEKESASRIAREWVRCCGTKQRE